MTGPEPDSEQLWADCSEFDGFSGQALSGFIQRSVLQMSATNWANDLGQYPRLQVIMENVAHRKRRPPDLHAARLQITNVKAGHA
jgi:hypothetical protein